MALIIVTLLPLITNALAYSAGKWIVTAAAVLMLDFFAWRLLLQALDVAAVRAQMLAIGALHLLASFGSLVALFAFRLPWWLQIVVLPLFLAPLLTHSWIRNTLLWAWRRRGARPVPLPDFPTPRPLSADDPHPD